MQEHRHFWTADYDATRDLVERTIPDQIVHIKHGGSTTVAGLLAKPIIDIDLTVPNVADEAVYVERREASGFRLIPRIIGL